MSQPVVTPEMEVEAQRHQELQAEINQLAAGRQKQLSQLNENTMVKQEMDLISGDAVVFKKIGPTLVRQDLDTAKDWISKRMEYVEKAIKNVDKQIGAKQEELQAVEDRVSSMQEAAQQKAAAAAAQARPAGSNVD